MSVLLPHRRALLSGGAALAGGLLLSGCDRLSKAPKFRDFLGSVQGLTLRAQRTLLVGQQLAREFRPDQQSPIFRVNGSSDPATPEYTALRERAFSDYRLRVEGEVVRPLALSLAQIRTLPARSQITRHDCVEGWSAIGKWTGAPLAPILRAAGLKPDARFVVFHCFDNITKVTDGSGLYYESIDLFDAFHLQTILAYSLNDEALPVGHGAPLRLRVERQLGYKQAKFVKRIEIVSRLENVMGGKGGFWEDNSGYDWYAGI